MSDETNGVKLDEENTLASHQEVKASIDGNVKVRVEPKESTELAGVAHELNHTSSHEEVETEREWVARISQVVNYFQLLRSETLRFKLFKLRLISQLNNRKIDARLQGKVVDIERELDQIEGKVTAETSNFISSPCETVTSEISLEDYCLAEEVQHTQCFPVVNESSNGCGIVAQADMAQPVSKKEDSLPGEIRLTLGQ